MVHEIELLCSQSTYRKVPPLHIPFVHREGTIITKVYSYLGIVVMPDGHLSSRERSCELYSNLWGEVNVSAASGGEQVGYWHNKSCRRLLGHTSLHDLEVHYVAMFTVFSKSIRHLSS